MGKKPKSVKIDYITNLIDFQITKEKGLYSAEINCCVRSVKEKEKEEGYAEDSTFE